MKIVILYSSGLDSYLLYQYAKIYYPEAEVKCLYYKHGAEAEEIEILKLPKYVDVRTIDWLSDEIKPLAKKDDPFAGAIYIPGRNLIFSSLAACQEIPDEIWMGTVWDEDNEKGTDKNEKFRNDTSRLLSYVLSPFLSDVKIRFPFVEEGWTKLDCLIWALNNNIQPNDITNTVSCWIQRGDVPCGTCKQCFKRALNFLSVDLKENYFVDPIYSDSGKKYIEMYLSSNSTNRDEMNVKKIILDLYNRDLFTDEVSIIIKKYYGNI